MSADHPHRRTPTDRALVELARLCGVVPVYRANDGRVTRVADATLRRVLATLGVDADDPAAALSRRRAELWETVVPPVVVSWLPGLAVLELRLPERCRGPFRLEVRCEDGTAHAVDLPTPEPAQIRATRTVDGRRFVVARAAFPEPLPAGYHEARLEVAGRSFAFLWIVAPREAHPVGDRTTALFVPVYALHSARRADCGDLTDWLRLAVWAGDRGVRLMGTLPLCAAFLEEPVEPSPYAPVSRLFWNEVYVDPEHLPELDRADPAGTRRALGADASASDPDPDRAAPEHVDWPAVAAHRSTVLHACADRYFADGGHERDPGLGAFLRTRPDAEAFACFRAAQARHGRNWRAWPEELQGRGPTRADVDERLVRHHLYAQWRAQQQTEDVLERMRAHGPELYLDLPLGTHPDGYDAFAYRAELLDGCSAGAPPDPFFTRGQDWGFAPLHPAASRAAGHRYLRASLRHQLAHCGALRVDHVMGLYRIWCVPHGLPADQGCYVRQPAEELFAILTLESRRQGCAVIGEDLGTVPVAVQRALREHGAASMHVVQFTLDEDDARRALEPAAGHLAALNTHDMPTFASFWRGLDVDQRLALGLLDDAGAAAERARRARQVAAARRALGLAPDPAHDDTGPALDACLEALARSDAEILVVGLEDLLGETRPQNVPGTGAECHNWQRRTRVSLDDLLADGRAAAFLESLAEVRSEPRRDPMANPKNPSRPPSGKPAPAAVPPDRPWSRLGELDLHLFNEGRHDRAYDKLGAHAARHDGVDGTVFAVWAPAAKAVSVIGDFNGWDPDATPLRPRGVSGIWEGFVAGVGTGAHYKYHIRSHHRGYRVDKADPYGFWHETPPKTASVVFASQHTWNDDAWMQARRARNALDAPMSIYELHLGSWRRADGEPMSYRAMAEPLIEHLRTTGFTHVELMPVMEHPFYGSWGYQVTGFFAPTSRYGTPDDLRHLIDRLHQAEIGVILDWVPSHFPSDEHGLVFFDGTHLYEHGDPRKGYHPDWKSMIFDYGRPEVASFLLSSARYWLDQFHADGLRVDGVASMLYLDYSRAEGEWIPNESGGRENLDAVRFLQRMNEVVYADFPDVQTIAEESTAWPLVSRPVSVGGLGFGMKWDMGWMHDTLRYMAVDPLGRKHHHGDLTFRSLYAWNENFVLSLSHDEVVHGKGSLLRKMFGDDWQRFANLRLLYAFMFATPGKKLLFMGSELAPWREWNHDDQLEWDLVEHETHGGVQRLVSDLNRIYREHPALHELDCEPQGFEWIDVQSAEHSVLITLRKGRARGAQMVVAMNFTPVPRTNYRVGVPEDGVWREVLNTDAKIYGGSGHGNLGALETTPVAFRDRLHSLNLTLPPLGAVFLALETPAPDAATTTEQP